MIQNSLKLPTLSKIQENLEFQFIRILNVSPNKRNYAYACIVYFIDSTSLNILKYSQKYNESHLYSFNISTNSKYFSINNIKIVKTNVKYYAFVACANQLSIFDIESEKIQKILEITDQSDHIVFISKALQFSESQSFLSVSTYTGKIFVLHITQEFNKTPLSIEKFEITQDSNFISNIIPRWLKSKKKQINFSRVFLFKQGNNRQYIEALILQNNQAVVYTIKIEANRKNINRKWISHMNYSNIDVHTLEDVEAQLIQNGSISRFYLYYIFEQDNKSRLSKLCIDSFQGKQIQQLNLIQFAVSNLQRFELQIDKDNIYVIKKSYKQNESEFLKINKKNNNNIQSYKTANYVIIANNLIISKNQIYELENQLQYKTKQNHKQKGYYYYQEQTNKKLIANRKIMHAISIYLQSIHNLQQLDQALKQKLNQLFKWFQILKKQQLQQLLILTAKQIVLVNIQIKILEDLLQNQKTRKILERIQEEDSNYLNFFLSTQKMQNFLNQLVLNKFNNFYIKLLQTTQQIIPSIRYRQIQNQIYKILNPYNLRFLNNILINEKPREQYLQNFLPLIFSKQLQLQILLELLKTNNFEICKKYAQKYRNDLIMTRLYCQTDSITGKQIITYIQYKSPEEKTKFMTDMALCYITYNKAHILKIRTFKLVIDFPQYHNIIYETINQKYKSCSWILGLKLNKAMEKKDFIQLSYKLNLQTSKILSEIMMKSKRDETIILHQNIIQACKKLDIPQKQKKNFYEYLCTRQWNELKVIIQKIYVPKLDAFLRNLDIGNEKGQLIKLVDGLRQQKNRI